MEKCKIWAIFKSDGPHIAMSRADAQNRLDFHFKFRNRCERKTTSKRKILKSDLLDPCSIRRTRQAGRYTLLWSRKN